MIVNNVAGLAGGGISLQDAVKVDLRHNTIANNDSLGVAGEAFAPGSPNQSTPQPGAGIASRAHSTELLATGAAIGTFSDPDSGPSIFSDNIVWQNRQFFFRVETGVPGDPNAPGVWGLCPDIGGTITGLACPGGNDPVFDDLGVLGTTGTLTGTAILTTPASPIPELFVAEYFNGNRSSVLQAEITTPIQPPPAFDEGGNFIRARFGPLTLFGNYHIIGGSAAENAGSSNTPNTDFDGETRPQGDTDIGADEI
jgi:hypothetical protein